jgi:hypothetical protein
MLNKRGAIASLVRDLTYDEAKSLFGSILEDM